MKPRIDPSSPAAEEPSTGVVRRYSVASRRRVPKRPRKASSSDGWRCLEWPPAESVRVMSPDPEVSLVQLSDDGELIQQRGSEAWLPEAAEFMARLSQLVARGLGFERCEEACLRGRDAVLCVARPARNHLVAMTGPSRCLSRVLTRVGLE
jgi:hypothetical protein